MPPTHPPAELPSLAPHPAAQCRVQDMPAARLYKRAGYDEVASDSFLVRLLAIDQRRLLRKRLPKPPPQQEPPQQQQQAPQPTEY